MVNKAELSQHLSILPWQREQWQQLVWRRQENRLSHALLFIGAPGLGKKYFAQLFSQTLLCGNAQESCGQCHSCYLFKAGSHPDFLFIEPEQGSQIKIDQIRSMVQFANETSLQGNGRVIVIYPANALNLNAANALLKTLEEPSPNVTIILISDQSTRLPATIVSRCQTIFFSSPSYEVAIEWLHQEIPSEKEDNFFQLLLSLTNYSPLKVKEWMDNEWLELRNALYQGLYTLKNPLQMAAAFQEKDMQFVLSLLLTWLQDLLRFHAVGKVECVNIDYQDMLAQCAQRVSSKNLLDYIDQVKKIYSHILNSMNLNRQLLLEELFIRWVQIC